MEMRNVLVGGYVAQTCRKTGDVFIGIVRKKNETTGTVDVQWGVLERHKSIVIVSELSPAIAADASALRSRPIRAPYGEHADGRPRNLEECD